MIIKRILLILRERSDHVLELYCSEEGSVNYFTLGEARVGGVPFGDDMPGCGARIGDIDVGASGWKERLLSLAQIAKERNCKVALLTESFSSYARSARVDWGSIALIKRLARTWLEIYETALLVAVSQPGVFEFSTLEDFCFAGGGFEPRLRVPLPAFKVSTGCAELMDMLRPQATITRDEINHYIKSVLISDIYARLARIEAIRARAVENRRARMLAEEPKYSTSRLSVFECGSVRDVQGFGPLVCNPAVYEGRPIFDDEPGRWLAHAPEPNAGEAEFIYPFLQLSGHYSLFLDVVSRDRRAKAMNVRIALTHCDSGEAAFEQRFTLVPGRSNRLSAEWRLEGEYNFKLGFSVSASEDNNYFTGAWINEARIVEFKHAFLL